MDEALVQETEVELTDLLASIFNDHLIAMHNGRPSPSDRRQDEVTVALAALRIKLSRGGVKMGAATRTMSSLGSAVIGHIRVAYVSKEHHGNQFEKRAASRMVHLCEQVNEWLMGQVLKYGKKKGFEDGETDKACTG